MKSFYIGILIIISSSFAYATHIVGGELTYICLGNNNYQLNLTVYRDCYNGDPNAFFDDPASIGIFNSDFELLDSVNLAFMGDDTLQPVLFNPCLVVPPNVCVHTTTYSTIVNLPQIPGGYIIAYQRCCRNQTINNIVSPLTAGATFTITITEKALNECNSSPKFNYWPPIYICVGYPISFDHSASDVDGDSVVYKLCTPFDGATYNAPKPQPPNPPPYTPIQWLNPPYSLANIMGGVPLSVDLHSGLMTGTPNTIGQFVVGVCAEEYRNGELISTMRRDFQYNVGECGVTTAAFFTPAVQCGDLTVTFQNNSFNGDGYEWTINGETITVFEPSYTFPDTGHYTVTLIASPNSECSDTTQKEISMQLASINPMFYWENGPCSDSIDLHFIDISTDSVSVLNNWSWTVKNGNTVLSSIEQNPTFKIGKTGNWVANLIVTAENGCMDTTQFVVNVDVISDTLAGDSLAICYGDSVALNPNPDEGNLYYWSPTSFFGNPTLPNPRVLPLETTNFDVVIYSADSVCTLQKSIKVVVPDEQVVVSLPNDSITCDNNILLIPETNTGVSFTWSKEPDFTPVLSNSMNYNAAFIGATTFYILVKDTYGCVAIDSIEVVGEGIDVSSEDLNVICPDSNIIISIHNLDNHDQLNYQWADNDGILNILTDSMVLVNGFMTNTYNVNISNQFGCETDEAIQINVTGSLPDVAIDIDRDTFFSNEPIHLSAISSVPNVDFEWKPKSLFENADSSEQDIVLENSTNIQLSVIDSNGCTNIANLFIVIITPDCKEPYVFVPNAFTPNADNNNDILYVRGANIESLYFAIYDRWGELVFETDDPKKGWDGSINGEHVPPDVYAYYLKVLCKGGAIYQKKGNVSILK